MLHYREQVLHMESVPLDEIVRHIGTPVYVYSLNELSRRVRAYREAFPDALIAYACKANANRVLLAHLTHLGCGADVVSAGELRAALSAGIPPRRVVFNGNAKTDEELRLAIQVGVRVINIDAREEIVRVAAAARDLGRQVTVALRVNPGLAVTTHPHLQVGAMGSHFGIPPEDVLPSVAEVMRESHLRFWGLHFHVGSQLTSRQDLTMIAQLAAEWVHRVREAGYPVEGVNLGGGLGIGYDGADTPSPQDVAAWWEATLAPLNLSLILEPGRWLVAPVGVLLVRVVQVKRIWGRTVVAVDGGMNVLLRPALYGARHRIWPLREGEPVRPVDVVGPICESADVLGRDCPLPPLKNGDILAILDAGAYGRSMASTYNGRPLPPEVVVDGTTWYVSPSGNG